MRFKKFLEDPEARSALRAIGEIFSIWVVLIAYYSSLIVFIVRPELEHDVNVLWLGCTLFLGQIGAELISLFLDYVVFRNRDGYDE